MPLSSIFPFFILILFIVTVEAINTKSNRTKVKHDFRFLVQAGYRPERSVLSKYIVSIRLGRKRKFFGDNHFCGGSIISPTAILTAAHCVTFDNSSKAIPPKAYSVRAIAGGKSLFRKRRTTRIYDVKRIAVYPNYDFIAHEGDIAVLHLSEEIELDNESRSVVPLMDEAPTPGMKCVLMGWGRIFKNGPRSEILTYVNLTLMNPLICKSANRFKLCTGDEYNYEMASGKGDSGGPLICDGKLVGVLVSSERLSDLSRNFPIPLYTYFMNVYEYRNWIEEALQSNAIEICPVYEILVLLLISFLFIDMNLSSIL